MERQFIKRNTKNQKLIAGIGKSELAKAYAKQYKKHYTNILYVEYTGDLHQDITDMDFIDDPPEISEQAPEKGISVLQKLLKGIKEYNSDCCLDYATEQETLGTIYLMTANLPQAKTHFKRACKIYEKIWADDPEMIEAKYQEIQELYPQVGFFLGQQISTFLTKQT